MEYKRLMDYLKDIYILEKSLYEQENIYWDIDNRIKYLTKLPKQTLNPLKKQNGISDNIELIGGSIIIGGIIGGVIGGISKLIKLWFYEKQIYEILFRIPELFSGLFKGLKIGIIIGLVLSIIGCIISAIKKERENKEILEQNRDITIQNEQNTTFINQKISILKQEQNMIKDFSSKTKYILNEFYNCNIIFPKYRNFVAISSIYEYLFSGRCSKLEGHEGAYNILENEIRQNIIINKLDEIINKLDTIKDNQYMLYSAIEDSNKKMDELTKEIYKISDNLLNISESSSICEYNSNIIMQNTELLKRVELFRN